MDTYSNDPNVDRFKQAKNEIEGVKDVMVQNIGNLYLLSF
jgi:hypothetical protein